MAHTSKKIGIILLFLCFMATSTAFAQRPDRIRVKPTNGQLSAEAKKEAYYYSEFKSGVIVFKNKVQHDAIINYNMLSGNIEFVNSKKDTMALANIDQVHQIEVGEETFLYDIKSQQLLRVLGNYNGQNLLVKERYELSNIKNVGAMGIETSSSSPSSSSNNQMIGDTQNRFKQNETLIFSLKPDYYFEHSSSYLPASKGSFYDAYPKYKSEIKKFIKQNRINFKSEADVRKLMQYTTTL